MPERPYAGFWIRLLAHLIDHVALSLAAVFTGLMILGAEFWVQTLMHVAPGDFFAAHDPFFLQLFLFSIYLVLAAAYYTSFVYLRGATLGKGILGLRVVDADTRGRVTLKQSAVRCAGYLLSWVLSVGYLLAAFQPRKRALHDFVAGTVVVMKTLIVAGFFLAYIAVAPAHAGDSMQLRAEWLSGANTGSGTEFGAAYLFSTRGLAALSFGPRLSLIQSDLAAGGQATLWFLNAIGAGVALEDVVSSSTSTGRLIFEPSVSGRLLRFGEHGAWAGKFGGQYDSSYKWAVKFGVTLELGGVSNLSESVTSE